ncbi:putative guanine nucleotide exchange protein C9orf72 [Monocercomonoides exilis]|uniref:putative guanine nucleotide exchange protein C9orf72 n=1 Tax=Monocercomonoides exilis TaxID=2049356 RepID=UPI00355967FA|nr:putative guanine nucleotide exchange protein C9orf72 [Monocercomonoides exilis]|eukprot:MONOS_14530.1-p1 / transcript=MONOS_14530.1 / gene=MONOS_14530 / organism=Monocercomonoides_exilis_PA203 / gene_product=unspecified product / transcript_product=unspecified product / location=Mono_scaffold01019:822-7278(-) / protein_length=1925 / sequence_SO=supercontig / SO=protein_coding / is_pseudo=false
MHFQTSRVSESLEMFPTLFYVDGFLLSTWDNILGPKVIKLWGSVSRFSTDELGYIGRNVLDSEFCKPSMGNNIESKISFLHEPPLLLISSLFAASQQKRESRFSFTLVVKRKYHSRYSKIATIIEERMSVLAIRLKNLLETVPDCINHFGKLLKKKALEIEALFMAGVKPPIVEETYLYAGDFETNSAWMKFLLLCLTSHLQTSGNTVVVGEDISAVNKMISTLLLFSPCSSCLVSRHALPLCDPSVTRTGKYSFRLPDSSSDFPSSSSSSSSTATNVSSTVTSPSTFSFTSVSHTPPPLFPSASNSLSHSASTATLKPSALFSYLPQRLSKPSTPSATREMISPNHSIAFNVSSSSSSSRSPMNNTYSSTTSLPPVKLCDFLSSSSSASLSSTHTEPLSLSLHSFSSESSTSSSSSSSFTSSPLQTDECPHQIPPSSVSIPSHLDTSKASSPQNISLTETQSFHINSNYSSPLPSSSSSLSVTLPQTSSNFPVQIPSPLSSDYSVHQETSFFNEIPMQVDADDEKDKDEYKHKEERKEDEKAFAKENLDGDEESEREREGKSDADDNKEMKIEGDLENEQKMTEKEKEKNQNDDSDDDDSGEDEDESVSIASSDSGSTSSSLSSNSSSSYDSSSSSSSATEHSRNESDESDDDDDDENEVTFSLYDHIAETAAMTSSKKRKEKEQEKNRVEEKKSTKNDKTNQKDSILKEDAAKRASDSSKESPTPSSSSASAATNTLFSSVQTPLNSTTNTPKQRQSRSHSFLSALRTGRIHLEGKVVERERGNEEMKEDGSFKRRGSEREREIMKGIGLFDHDNSVASATGMDSPSSFAESDAQLSITSPYFTTSSSSTSSSSSFSSSSHSFGQTHSVLSNWSPKKIPSLGFWYKSPLTSQLEHKQIEKERKEKEEADEEGKADAERKHLNEVGGGFSNNISSSKNTPKLSFLSPRITFQPGLCYSSRMSPTLSPTPITPSVSSSSSLSPPLLSHSKSREHHRTNTPSTPLLSNSSSFPPPLSSSLLSSNNSSNCSLCSLTHSTTTSSISSISSSPSSSPSSLQMSSEEMQNANIKNEMDEREVFNPPKKKKKKKKKKGNLNVKTETERKEKNDVLLAGLSDNQKMKSESGKEKDKSDKEKLLKEEKEEEEDSADSNLDLYFNETECDVVSVDELRRRKVGFFEGIDSVDVERMLNKKESENNSTILSDYCSDSASSSSSSSSSSSHSSSSSCSFPSLNRRRTQMSFLSQKLTQKDPKTRKSSNSNILNHDPSFKAQTHNALNEQPSDCSKQILSDISSSSSSSSSSIFSILSPLFSDARFLQLSQTERNLLVSVCKHLFNVTNELIEQKSEKREKYKRMIEVALNEYEEDRKWMEERREEKKGENDSEKEKGSINNNVEGNEEEKQIMEEKVRVEVEGSIDTSNSSKPPTSAGAGTEDVDEFGIKQSFSSPSTSSSMLSHPLQSDLFDLQKRQMRLILRIVEREKEESAKIHDISPMCIHSCSMDICVLAEYVPGLAVQGVHSRISPSSQQLLRHSQPSTIINMDTLTVLQHASDFKFYSSRSRYLHYKLSRDTEKGNGGSSRSSVRHPQLHHPQSVNTMAPILEEIVLNAIGIPHPRVREQAIRQQMLMLQEKAVTTALLIQWLSQQLEKEEGKKRMNKKEKESESVRNKDKGNDKDNKKKWNDKNGSHDEKSDSSSKSSESSCEEEDDEFVNEKTSRDERKRKRGRDRDKYKTRREHVGSDENDYSTSSSSEEDEEEEEFMRNRIADSTESEDSNSTHTANSRKSYLQRKTPQLPQATPLLKRTFSKSSTSAIAPFSPSIQPFGSSSSSSFGVNFPSPSPTPTLPQSSTDMNAMNQSTISSSSGNEQKSLSSFFKQAVQMAHHKLNVTLEDVKLLLSVANWYFPDFTRKIELNEDDYGLINLFDRLTNF